MYANCLKRMKYEFENIFNHGQVIGIKENEKDKEVDV